MSKNGGRRADREDVRVFGDDGGGAPSGARIWINLLKDRERHPDGKIPEWQHTKHAVLGDGPVRLCGYKCYPELYAARGETIEKIELPREPGEAAWRKLLAEAEGEIEAEGGIYRWRYERGENRVFLHLIEPDGARWTGECGFEMGAGFEG